MFQARIPLGAGEILHSAEEPPPLYPSIYPCDSDFDFTKTIADKDNLVKTLCEQKYYSVLQSPENAELTEASASFIPPKKVKVADKTFVAYDTKRLLPQLLYS